LPFWSSSPIPPPTLFDDETAAVADYIYVEVIIPLEAIGDQGHDECIDDPGKNDDALDHRGGGIAARRTTQISVIDDTGPPPECDEYDDDVRGRGRWPYVGPPWAHVEQKSFWATSWSEFQDNFVIDVVMCGALLVNSSEHSDAGSYVYSQ
jgi:hypothetical protein